MSTARAALVPTPRGVAPLLAAGLRAVSRAGDPGVSLARRLTDRIPRALDPQGAVAVRRDGIAYRLDTRDYLQRHVYYTGRYEPAVLDFLLGELQDGDVFVDVGANIGIYALPAARRLAPSGGAVLAFDPSVTAGRAMLSSAVAAGIGNLRWFALALGDRAARRALRHPPELGEGDLGSATLYGTGGATEDVDVVAYDDWAAEADVPRTDVVKIDVEGGEQDVLRGMTGTIEARRPRAIVIEVVAPHLERAGSSIGDLVRLIDELGYREDGPCIEDVARGNCGRLGSNVVLRPREHAARGAAKLAHGRAFRAARAIARPVGLAGRGRERRG